MYIQFKQLAKWLNELGKSNEYAAGIWAKSNSLMVEKALVQLLPLVEQMQTWPNQTKHWQLNCMTVV